jgi:large subunit ribosomal protein L13
MTTINKTIKQIDATGKSVGRVATEIASILMGKTTPHFAKNKVEEVSVEVSNAAKVNVKGNKMQSQVQKRYSGFPSGLSLPNWADVASKKGFKQLIIHAVEGMLPTNRLHKGRMKNLVVND